MRSSPLPPSTCDNLQQVTLIDAQATTLEATATSEPDLFWACRGGGGGIFGIATQFVLRIFPLSDVLLFGVSWLLLSTEGGARFQRLAKLGSKCPQHHHLHRETRPHSW